MDGSSLINKLDELRVLSKVICHVPDASLIDNEDAINQEENEEFVIVKPDAISNPRAVMIHSDNTIFALLAVMGSGDFDFFTLEAISSFLELKNWVFGNSFQSFIFSL